MIDRDYTGLRLGSVATNSEVHADVSPDRPTRRRGAAWSLARVCERGFLAIAVWQALVDLARDRNSLIVTPTREMLGAAIGRKRHKSISRALTILERARWISRMHVPVGDGDQRTATLLRIELCRMGRLAPSTERIAVKGAKRPKGKGRKTPQDSL